MATITSLSIWDPLNLPWFLSSRNLLPLRYTCRWQLNFTSISIIPQGNIHEFQGFNEGSDEKPIQFGHVVNNWIQKYPSPPPPRVWLFDMTINRPEYFMSNMYTNPTWFLRGECCHSNRIRDKTSPDKSTRTKCYQMKCHKAVSHTKCPLLQMGIFVIVKLANVLLVCV